MPERKNKNLENLAQEQEPKIQILDKGFKKIPQTKEQLKNLEGTTEGQISLEKQEISPITQTQPQTKKSKEDFQAQPEYQALKEEVEDILETGLENLYLDMSKEKQVEFRAKGEETANKISRLLMQAKIQVKKIIYAIIDWLKIIPGINKFFIKQTAKIKTDQILKLKPKQNKK